MSWSLQGNCIEVTHRLPYWRFLEEKQIEKPTEKTQNLGQIILEFSFGREKKKVRKWPENIFLKHEASPCKLDRIWYAVLEGALGIKAEKALPNVAVKRTMEDGGIILPSPTSPWRIFIRQGVQIICPKRDSFFYLTGVWRRLEPLIMKSRPLLSHILKFYFNKHPYTRTLSTL